MVLTLRVAAAERRLPAAASPRKGAERRLAKAARPTGRSLCSRAGRNRIRTHGCQGHPGDALAGVPPNHSAAGRSEVHREGQRNQESALPRTRAERRLAAGRGHRLRPARLPTTARPAGRRRACRDRAGDAAGDDPAHPGPSDRRILTTEQNPALAESRRGGGTTRGCPGAGLNTTPRQLVCARRRPFPATGRRPCPLVDGPARRRAHHRSVAHGVRRRTYRRGRHRPH